METLEDKKGGWNKLVTLAPLLTPLVVALIPAVGAVYLNARDSREAAARQAEQELELRARLYTELMTQRETAESTLRKDMLVKIMDLILTPDGHALETQVVRLELLSYNFHDAINIKPLFLHLQNKILESREPAWKKQGYAKRLHRVAREIIQKQLVVLEGERSAGKEQRVDMWIRLTCEGAEGTDCLDQTPGHRLSKTGTLTLDGITRELTISVTEADLERQELKVSLDILTKTREGSAPARTQTPSFTIGRFDFPMIDNTRLSHDQRYAVVLNAMNKGEAKITVICFPGSYASLKEKPYIEDVIRASLKQESRAEEPPANPDNSMPENPPRNLPK